MLQYDIKKLKRKLDYHYKAFDKSTISPDPLELPHRFERRDNIELVAFIASVFAYGNVTQIIKSLDRLFEIIGPDPIEFLKEYNFEEGKKIFEDIKHRFYTPADIAALFHGVKRAYESYGSLNYLFTLYYFGDEENIKSSLSFFSNNLLELAESSGHKSRGLSFMFPDPYKGSACKRMNLFLRWMVREDELDFGFWKEIDTGQLIIPVDTHIARICKSLGLTEMNNVSWKMAEEITNNLKRINREDPVKYDFAICHIGMRKLDF